MLIQVGVIDTTTEQAPIRAAIIMVNKTEIILNLELDSVLKDHFIEKYSGDQYELTLEYSMKKDARHYGSPIYPGMCTIRSDKLTSKYEIV